MPADVVFGPFVFIGPTDRGHRRYTIWIKVDLMDAMYGVQLPTDENTERVWVCECGASFRKRDLLMTHATLGTREIVNDDAFDFEGEN